MAPASSRLENPMPEVALAWGSRSIRRTFWSYAASAAERLMAVVVLPTPPFWLAIAMIRAMRSGGLCSRTGKRPIENRDECSTWNTVASISVELAKSRYGPLVRAGDREDLLPAPVRRRQLLGGLVRRPEKEEPPRPQKQRFSDRLRKVS